MDYSESPKKVTASHFFERNIKLVTPSEALNACP